MSPDAGLKSNRFNDRPPVVYFTAPNPGPKTLSGTHTYLVGHGEGYVIDPGPDAQAYQEDLAGWIRRSGTQVRGILLTHAHPDHAPGAYRLKRLLDVPVWISAATPEADAARAGADSRYGVRQTFQVDGDVLHVLPSPGHTPDHVAFWLDGARILFAGDTILGQGTTLIAPPEGDMALYMETLERMRALKPRIIAPGHGPMVTDPRATIREYVEHRQMRERQVLEALSQGPATILELVGQIYVELDPRLWDLAGGSVEAQLEKLVREGRVERRGELFQVAEDSGKL